jgi:hypothetical protein
MVDHPRAALPSQVEAVAAPQGHQDAVLAARPMAARAPALPALASRTRAPAHAGHGRGHVHQGRLVDGVLGRPPRRGVRGGAVCGGRARTGHCLPVRQLPDIDRRSRGGRVWRGPWGRIQPPPAEPPPPEEPPSARARPPATRRTGRAALPSAIFPHTLPAFGQRFLALSAQCSIAAAPPRAKPVTFNVIVPP